MNMGQRFREAESIQLLCSFQLEYLPEYVYTSLSSLGWANIFYFLFISFICSIYFFFISFIFVVLCSELDAGLPCSLHSFFSSLVAWFIWYTPLNPSLSVIISALISFTCYRLLSCPTSQPMKRGMLEGYRESLRTEATEGAVPLTTDSECDKTTVKIRLCHVSQLDL